MSKSSIEWTDDTWNPVSGCTRVSAGCDNCYAVKMTKRLEAMGQEKYANLVNIGKGHFNGVVRCKHPMDKVTRDASIRKEMKEDYDLLADCEVILLSRQHELELARQAVEWARSLLRVLELQASRVER
jgi:hypothetical protein